MDSNSILQFHFSCAYPGLLARYEPERKLYLAVPGNVIKSVFEEEAGQVLLEDQILRLLIFDTTKEEVFKWTP